MMTAHVAPDEGQGGRPPVLASGGEVARMRRSFLAWQCRVRQVAMRKDGGRPDAACAPQIFLPRRKDALGRCVTVLNKLPQYSIVAELQHYAKRTHDPAQWRADAVRLLSSAHYQHPEEFSDTLCATFAPSSLLAKQLLDTGECTLRFAAYSQRFALMTQVQLLSPQEPFHQATLAHNRLFNPDLPPGIQVIGFVPVWHLSDAAANGFDRKGHA